MIALLSHSNVTRRILPLTASAFSQFFHHFARNLVDGIIGGTQSAVNTRRCSTSMQVKHTFQNCKQCQLKFNHVQVLFPIKRKRFTGFIMMENNPKVANKAIKVQVPSQPGSTTLREAGETAKSLYDQVNPMFEKITAWAFPC
jgi:hypothetical protein